LTGFTAPKILWVRDHEPEIYAQIAHFLLPKDYLRFQLTGEYVMDLSDAAGTSLLDVANRRWSDEVIAALELPHAWFPALAEGTAITGVISDHAAQITGLKAGTPVVGGGGDQAAGAVGVGAVEEGIIGVAVGTSGVVFAPLSRYAYEPQGRLHAFCHCAPDLWHFMGVMLSAAGSLQWYRDQIAPHASFDDLTADAAAIPAGSEGLLFMPYLTGERTPHPDPLARGAFIGLTARHTRAHMTRAVLEGVAFGLQDSFELMKAANMAVTQVRISGGGAKSPLWRQIMADVFQAPLTTTATTEGAAYGAAVCAAVGAGFYPDVQAACRAMVALTGDATLPSAQAEAYHAPYALYRELYPSLAGIFARL
jgi:xylulokinase